ncbi:MAG TPA: hypothetical protein VNX40_13745 [Mucilaginibacter sp.]|nr:hypothetical protein [Mucilaginibacter sp.]
MDWTYFFIGVGFITVAYLIYRDVKGKKSYNEGNEPGTNISYFKGWSAVITLIIAGISLIILSFQS